MAERPESLDLRFYGVLEDSLVVEQRAREWAEAEPQIERLSSVELIEFEPHRYGVVRVGLVWVEHAEQLRIA